MNVISYRMLAAGLPTLIYLGKGIGSSHVDLIHLLEEETGLKIRWAYHDTYDDWVIAFAAK